jgi:hypothetical protein
MTMYVYDTGGEPVGFLFEMTLFDLAGTARGRLIGSRVHRFDGSYAGEWFHQMVVLRASGRPRWVRAIPPPPPRASPGTSYRRRPVGEYRDYADAFHLLCEPSGEDAAAPYRQAAE